jgi:hypothetical protein
MANKPYRIYRSNATGQWCCEIIEMDKDDKEIVTDQQCFPTKREARQYGKDHTGNGNSPKAKPTSKKSYRILPPHIDANVKCGRLKEFGSFTPKGYYKTITTKDVSENTALWYFGMDCFDPKQSEKWELVAATLIIWDFYHGGHSEETIKKNHNMSDKIFKLIADKKWVKLEIFEDEETGAITWGDCR